MDNDLNIFDVEFLEKMEKEATIALIEALKEDFTKTGTSHRRFCYRDVRKAFSNKKSTLQIERYYTILKASSAALDAAKRNL